MNKQQSEKEITKTISFIIASKRVKYLGINPRSKRHTMKTLLKEILKGINGNTSYVQGLEDLVLLTC